MEAHAKTRAIALRKQGKSYTQIKQKIGVAKSTLSYWLKDISLSAKAKKRIETRAHKKSIDALIRRNKAQTALAKERADDMRTKAKKDVHSFSKKDLFLLGAALYWAEGYKRGADTAKAWRCVDFTNADPSMVSLMMGFFRQICRVEEKKFRLQLIVHKRMNEKNAKMFWSEVTGIPIKQFFKSSRTLNVASKGRRTNRLPYGTLHVRVYDVALFYRIIGWIDGIKEKTASDKLNGV